MINFTPVPNAKLDIKTGTLTGVAPKPTPVNVGIPTEELHKQAIDLVNKKIPLEKALKAVDSYPDIQDKTKAKSMVSAVYQIMGSKK
jgi:hypothetical protein